MAYITVEELEDFAHKYPDEDESLQGYVDGALEAIERYLGYDPEEHNYTSVVEGDNGELLALKAKPITAITEIKVRKGVELDKDEFMIMDDTNFIMHEAKDPFFLNTFYEVKYTAGYETVPSIIKMTALQIANLLWESSGGNLAVSSTTYANTGSRVFNNFTLDRFLKQIESYKVYIK